MAFWLLSRQPQVTHLQQRQGQGQRTPWSRRIVPVSLQQLPCLRQQPHLLLRWARAVQRPALILQKKLGRMGQALVVWQRLASQPARPRLSSGCLGILRGWRAGLR